MSSVDDGNRQSAAVGIGCQRGFPSPLCNFKNVVQIKNKLKQTNEKNSQRCSNCQICDAKIFGRSLRWTRTRTAVTSTATPTAQSQAP